MDESSYPALSEMGITRFHEVSHYRLRDSADGQQALTVYYERAAGSMLPESRKYKFPQPVSKDASGQLAEPGAMDLQQFLLQAIAELDQIAERRKGLTSRKERLLEEFTHLQRVVSQRVSDLQKQIEKLESS